VVTAQTAGDMRKDDVTVVEFDGKHRAWKNLLDASEDLERGFFVILSCVCFWRTGCGVSFTSDDGLLLLILTAAALEGSTTYGHRCF
jgi:hypothetical protein